MAGPAPTCTGCNFGTHLPEGPTGSVAGSGGSGISVAGGNTLDAPSFVYRGGSTELGIANAYTRDYTFPDAYRYYGIRASDFDPGK